jgi:uncharacterized sulfatase
MPTEPDRPNIIVFFTDQQRWDTAGCYGQQLETTPNLDRMAAGGVRFEHAFTCQPVCGPARACVQTGKWATQTGCFRNGIALPTDEKTIAHWLSAAGYEVGYIGKWHLASTGKEHNYRDRPVPPERRGGYKDYWLASDVLEFTSHSYDGHMFDGRMNKVEFPPDRYRADCLGDFAIEYLRTRTGERPFFLFLSFIEPHQQNDHNRYEGPRGSAERFSDFPVPGDLVDTQGDWREQWPDYLGCVSSLDDNLGRLRDELERLGIADDTLVLFTSDHGSHFRTRNAEYKRSCHESSIRIPLVACGPGFRGGKVVGSLVSLIDVPPTILSAAGVAVPDTMRGFALQRVIDSEPADWRREVFIQISEDHVGRAIRTRRWKYEVLVPAAEPYSGRDRPASDVYTEGHLYDLEADPHERNNLAREASLAEVRAELAARLKRRMVQAGERQPEVLPATKA